MRTNRTKLAELSWLSQVKETKQPLSEQYPIWVRHGTIHSGPPVPHPERHPYCEFGTNLEGMVTSFVEREQARRRPGDLFLAGPGVPHWAEITDYPLRFITIYFLPSVLIELGPGGDGLKILRRFTARQSLAERLVRPPAFLAPRLRSGFEEMIDEFERKSFGHEVRLRTLLTEMLVHLLRWEQEMGREVSVPSPTTSWEKIEATLKFLHEHFAEEIYAHDLASAAGVSESRLKTMFRETLGMPWSRYLQGYRIHRAAALLSEAGHSVLETALAVGFESLSHFTATFRSMMGVSPGLYARRATGKKSKQKHILARASVVGSRGLGSRSGVTR